MNKWKNEQMKEWTNEWMNEWMNDQKIGMTQNHFDYYLPPHHSTFLHLPPSNKTFSI